MLFPSRFVAAFALCSAVAALTGCARQPPAAVKTAPPDVIVTLPVVRNVTDAEDFTGRVGGSDLNGTLVYTQRDPRPLLSGDLVSNLLQFSDLAPIIGADSNASRKSRGDTPTPSPSPSSSATARPAGRR